jgi:prepilin-type N-terminal cleavage/methylation domain-containing protein
MKKLKVKGFSMIELLVVLLIIGILAAVAAPLFIGNSDKAKVSEAVAGLGSIRSGERTYYSQNGGYLTVTDGKTYFGTAGGNQSSVLGAQIHGVRYFSPKSYTVATSSLSWGGTVSGVSTNPQDFVITANGSSGTNLTLASDTTDGAAYSSEVGSFKVQMDNAGQVIYTTDGSTWNKY